MAAAEYRGSKASAKSVKDLGGSGEGVSDVAIGRLAEMVLNRAACVSRLCCPHICMATQ